MELITEIKNIVTKAGQIMLGATDIMSKSSKKTGKHDLVTVYDLKIQSFLSEKLKNLLPGAVIMGEEDADAYVASTGADDCFIIDPIDGTANFIFGCRYSAISVGLQRKGRTIAGVIYNPYSEEMFWAVAGRGAMLNNTPIRTNNLDLSSSIVTFGTSPYHRPLAEKTFEIMRTFYSDVLDIRRSGSAALDLCSVACGRSSLFFELHLSPWDYCAGALIVAEAGGIVTDTDGKPLPYDRPSSVVAGNKTAHSEFLKRSSNLS
ncbi:MAG: inositol monophosphatase [Clostridiales bacterium]|nr:inositol monophosphatase [Clostridiales bacterium]